jgi:hypothetical protein
MINLEMMEMSSCADDFPLMGQCFLRFILGIFFGFLVVKVQSLMVVLKTLPIEMCMSENVKC